MITQLENQRAPAAIVCDPAVCGGVPTFRGTRIPVEMILVHLRAGYTREEIFTHYPRLPLDGIEAAIAWAQNTVGPHWRERDAAE